MDGGDVGRSVKDFFQKCVNDVDSRVVGVHD